MQLSRFRKMLLALLLIIASTQTAMAEITPEIYHNGYRIYYTEDQKPYLSSKGKVMIPFRLAIETLLKKEIIHNKDAQLIITETEPKLIVSLIKLEVINENNDIILPRDEVELRNNRLYVPIRFLVENFNAQIAWNNNTKSAYINTDGTYPIIPKHGVIVTP